MSRTSQGFRVLVLTVASVLAVALGEAHAGEPVSSQYILGRLVPVTGQEGVRSIDLDIKFELNSAALTEAAKAQLAALGQALTAPALSEAPIGIYGHTDASGVAARNHELSQKRADSVKRYLITEFKLDPQRLEAVGYGATRLKNAADPKAAENRRVEIVNKTPPAKAVPPTVVPAVPQPAPVAQPTQPGGMQAIN